MSVEAISIEAVEQARKVMEQEKIRRELACFEEINAVLKKYDCKLDSRTAVVGN